MPLTQTQAAIRLISESLGDTADMLVTTNFGGEWTTPEQPTVGYLNPPIPVPAGTEILVRLTGTAGPASGPAEIRSDVFADQIAGVYEVRCANSVVAPLGST